MAVDNLAIKVYEYKLRPNKKFVGACELTLRHCRQLYNACLEQRISYYRYTGLKITWLEQCRQLTDLRQSDEDASKVARAIQTETIRRLERTYQAFFRRVKEGGKAGFPRFKSRERFTSFETPIDQRKPCPLQGDKLRVYGIGTCRVRLSRPITGQVKIVRIIRRADGYFAQLVCETAYPKPLQKTGHSIGVDVGIESFATLSTGEKITNPRFTENAEKAFIKANRDKSRKKVGSQNRKKSRETLARKHLKVSRARKHFHYQIANDLVRRFDFIFVEKLNVRGMVKNHNFAKSISSVAWSLFLEILSHKAAEAGRIVEKVSPNYTSQLCSGCGAIVKKNLSERKHSCSECGLEIHRDHNAAINIRSRGLAVESGVTLTLKQERDSGSYLRL